MRKVGIIFSYRKSLISWLISKYLKTPFSHVALILQDPLSGRKMIVEADAEGVNLIPFHRWSREGNKIIYSHNFAISEERYKEVWTFCMDKLQVPYGFNSLFGFFFRDGTKVGTDGDFTYICSELAYKALHKELSHLGKTQDRVSPKTIFDYIQKKHPVT